MSLAPCTLSDDDLIVTIASLAGVERSATASLIAHLAELETRNLHLAQGFRSLFGYCRRVLHCSEHEAYNRMEAAARRFPVILALLAEGLLHLTAVRLLAPHLKDEDHLALLGGAIHKSKREIVASRARVPIGGCRLIRSQASSREGYCSVGAAVRSGRRASDRTVPVGRDLRRLRTGAEIRAGRAAAYRGPSVGGSLPPADHDVDGRA